MAQDNERDPIYPTWSFHFPPEMKAEVEALRREHGTSRAEMVRQLLAEALEARRAIAV